MRLIAEIKTMGNAMMLQTHQALPQLEGKYEVLIKEIGKHRSLEQNAKLWALICEICKKVDGDISSKDTVYTQILKMAGAKYEIFTLKKSAYDDKALDKFGIRNYEIVKSNDKFVTVIAFYGSSKMNTKEMSELIDTTFKYASQSGVSINEEYWRDILNG